MKNSTWVTISLVIGVAFALGFSSSPLANATVTPTLSPINTTTASSTPTRTRTRSTSSATPTWTVTQSPTETPTLATTRSATPSVVVTATADLRGSTPATKLTPSINIPAAAKYVLAMDAKSLDVDTLRARSYGGNQVKITRTLENDSAFRKVQFEYSSDGLKITGVMNIPRGTGPFPVVILDHGYFAPSEYKSGDGTNPASDNFARHGYLTLAPDYRCYGGSQCGPNPLYVGYAIDVLNLIGSLSSIPEADTSRVGIWGHSMGGGITLRVLAVSRNVKVASLYGALTGDDEVHYCWLNDCPTPAAPRRAVRVPRMVEIDPDFTTGLPTPVPAAPDPMQDLKAIFVKSSPIRHMQYINTPVIIHHGESDDIVPIQWSVDLAAALNSQGKVAELYTYPGQGHVFTGWNWQLFMARTIEFFDNYLVPRESPVTVERRVLKQESGISDLGY